MAPTAESLAPLALAYLERQPWFGLAIAGLAPAPAALLSYSVLRDGRPGLARLLVGRGERRFQLLVGWRNPAAVAGMLGGREEAIIGSADDGGEDVLVYEALADDTLALELLDLATQGAEHAERVRHVSTLVSHASLVFDDRLFMKCYRVLEPGVRPEVEAMLRLDSVGFNAMLAPIAAWRAEGFDVALVREFLPGALEGRLLALTSLRDLLARAAEVREASGAPAEDLEEATSATGGDLASEMRRLGAMTGSLHLALAAAFGDRVATPEALAAIVAAGCGEGLERLERARSLVGAIAALEPGTTGRAIRLHGDYHLRRVMRAEPGWVVAGFSDDPLYASRRPHTSLPARTGSPLEDVADMCFSLRQVAREAAQLRPSDEAELAEALAGAWARRNQEAFLEGYRAAPGIDRLLPGHPAAAGLLLEAFALVRDRRYEASPAEG
ncbi:MAG TPA: hypothetical protein VKV23_05205 [Acidimicrobiales bacterium]|nr:hypothetical protein [Acidimicrobiales bacterium]